MTMGEKIRALRTEKGMTLEQVGNLVGVGKSTVRKWENGMIENMRRDKIANLSRALGTTPAYLMGWEQDDEDGTENMATFCPEDIVQTPEEKRLLAYYRNLPENKRIALLQFLGIDKEK